MENTFVERARRIHGDRYDYSESAYTGRHRSLSIRCPRHGSFSQEAGSHLLGSGCPRCGIEARTNARRNTLDKFLATAKTIHGDRYDYSRVDYRNNRTRVEIICREHGQFEQAPAVHLRGRGCPRCSNKISSESRKLSLKNFLIRAHARHGTRFDYSRTNYVNSKSKVEIGCTEGHWFWQTPNRHLAGNGCLKCSGLERMTVESFISEANMIHKNKYDYSSLVYKNNKTKITIVCPVHGAFNQVPQSHLAGNGCPKCVDNFPVPENEFIRRANSKHSGKYDYSYMSYRNLSFPIDIFCPVVENGILHGRFSQSPSSHIDGHGCPRCGGNMLKTKSKFVEDAVRVHGNRYNYDDSVYVNGKSKIEIDCPISDSSGIPHGTFKQAPDDHLMGQGCPRCSHHASKGEDEIGLFLTGLGVRVILRDRTVIGPKELDLWLPEHNIAIEYCGLIWHSDRYRKDSHHLLDKHLECAARGIRLITIFSDEWKQHRSKVEASLRHFVGKTERGVYGRKALIREIDWKTAKPFLDTHHLLGSGASGRNRIGAFDGDRLIAVMTFGSPSDERGRSGVVEMKRYVSDGRNHPGLASKMFQYAIQAYKFERVLAFVDRRWFRGSFKSIAGFVQTSETRPSLFWVKGTRRYHRRVMTKKLAQKKAILIPGETKLDMMRRLGYDRIWDCGKLRLEWNRNPV